MSPPDQSRWAAAIAILAPEERALLELWGHGGLGDARLASAAGIAPEGIAVRRGRICMLMAEAVDLDPGQRALLYLWADHGLDEATLVARTGVKPEALRQRRVRIVAQLSEALGVSLPGVENGLEALSAAARQRNDSDPEVAHRPSRANVRRHVPEPPDEPPMAPTPTSGASLRHFHHRISERLRVVLACAVLAAVAAFVGQAISPRHYHATALLVVDPVRADNPNFSGIPILSVGGDPSTARTTAQSVVAATSVAELAAARLGTAWSPARVASNVAVTAASNANIVRVTSAADTAAAARQLADTYANAALRLRREEVTPAVTAQLASAASQLQAVARNRRVSSSAQVERYAAIASLVGAGDPTLSLARPAVVAPQISRRHQAAIVVFALAAGALLGAVGGWFAGPLSRRRIRDEHRLVKLLGIPLLATLEPDRSDELTMVPALDRLTTLLLASERPPQTIAFAGCDNGEGKTTLATAFAVHLARRGARVTLLDLDWWTWDAHRRLNVLQDLSPTGRRAPVGSDAVLRPSPSVPGLTVGAVYSAVNPEAVSEAVEAARYQANYVILDTPSFGTSASSIGVLSAADIVILVAATGRTSEADLLSLQAALAQADIPPSGVINLIPDESAESGSRGRRLRSDPRYGVETNFARSAL